jgi:hypothetical protein
MPLPFQTHRYVIEVDAVDVERRARSRTPPFDAEMLFRPPSGQESARHDSFSCSGNTEGMTIGRGGGTDDADGAQTAAVAAVEEWAEASA